MRIVGPVEIEGVDIFSERDGKGWHVEWFYRGEGPCILTGVTKSCAEDLQQVLIDRGCTDVRAFDIEWYEAEAEMRNG